MSETFPPSTERQPNVPPKGLEEYLSPDERKFWQRGLGFPEDFPPKFRSWLVDFIAVNIPQIPISQIVGFTQFKAAISRVITQESTTSTSYTNLTTVGPSITGLSNGQYLLIYGATCKGSVTGDTPTFSPSNNGATPSDNDSALNTTNDFISVVGATLMTLSTSDNNTVTLKYKRVLGTATFKNRWIIGLKIGN